FARRAELAQVAGQYAGGLADELVLALTGLGGRGVDRARHGPAVAVGHLDLGFQAVRRAVRRIEEDGLAHQRPLGGGHLLRRLLGGRRVDLFLGGRRRRRVVSGGDGAGAEQQG